MIGAYAAVLRRVTPRQLDVLKNVGVVAVWRGIQFLTALQATRIQSLEQTGVSGVILSVAAVSAVILDLGVSTHILRLPREEVRGASHLIRTNMWFKVGVLVIGLAMFFAPWFSRVADKEFVAVAFALVYFCYVFDCTYLFQIDGKAHWVNTVGAASAVVPCVVVLLRKEAFPTAGELILIYGFQLAGMVSLFVYYVVAKKWERTAMPAFPSLMAHVLTHRALLGKSILLPAMGYLDALVVATFAGLKATGTFRIASICAGLTNLLAASIHPYFVGYFNQRPASEWAIACRRLLVKSFLAAAAIMAVTLPPAAAFAWWARADGWKGILLMASGLIAAKALILPTAVLDTWFVLNHQDRRSMLFCGTIGLLTLLLYMTALQVLQVWTIGFLQVIAILTTLWIFGRWQTRGPRPLLGKSTASVQAESGQP